MNLRFWRKDSFKTSSAPLGSPENPEIIEPGQIYRRPMPRNPLFLQAPRLFMMLILPAIVLDWLCYNLVELGMQSGGVVAWLLLLIIAPPALMATFVAVITGSFLTLFAFLAIFARPLRR